MEDFIRIKVAKQYADKCHSSTNHLYDGKPYVGTHCKLAVDWAYKFRFLIEDEDFEYVIAALWCHDVEEDTRQTYNDICKNIGKRSADMVHALTNEKGKNRHERANSKYYREMRKVKYAVFCKLCDRLANIQYSKQQNTRMLEVYRKEYADFQDKIYDENYIYMFKEICTLLDIEFKKPGSIKQLINKLKLWL